MGGLYNSYQRNADGSYAVGGAYDGYQRNADGSYALGGRYSGYQRNADGSFAVGGAYTAYMRTNGRNSPGSSRQKNFVDSYSMRVARCASRR